MANINGDNGDNTLVGLTTDDRIEAYKGRDTISDLGGDDTIFGGAGDDTYNFDLTTGGLDLVDLGTGDDDMVNVTSAGTTEIRLTFTSAEVGDNNANDSGMLTNQDGGLAVRLSAEDGADALTGDVSRFDDEGITFVAASGTTFDVRDLTNGAQRGNQFTEVSLGTSENDRFNETGQAGAYYINGGAGDDDIRGGVGADFLVGGSGVDTLAGKQGEDSFIGGGGGDSISGGDGDDVAIYDTATAGEDSTDLEDGDDEVRVISAGVSQVRLTFTSAEVGDDSENDGGSLANQDGGLAVRLQAESAGDPSGSIGRFDDEGVTFTAQAGTTFQVNDLVSGVTRGDQFNTVQLGTGDDDLITGGAQGGQDGDYYINAGAGIDTVRGGDGDDFLVGGAGGDFLRGGDGDDSFIGGAGRDQINGGEGSDVFIFAAFEDGRAARINGLSNNDTINLAGVDADSGTAGDQAVTFVDDFSNTAGEATLTYNERANSTVLAIDTDGDGESDMTILLANGDYTDFDNFVL